MTAASLPTTARRGLARGLLAFAADLTPHVFALLTFAAGLVLLASSASPRAAERLRLLREIAPLFVVEVSHFTGSIIGVLLLVVATGLWSRRQGAWAAASALLAAGIAASLLKGLDYEEAALLGAVLAALLPNRGVFHRTSRFAGVRVTPPWLLAAAAGVGGAVWLFLFSFRHVEYSDELWWRFLFDADASRALRATAGAAVTLLVVALWAFTVAPDRREPALPTPESLARAEAVVRSAEHARPEAALALLGDKALFFSASGDSLIAYAQRGGCWIAVGEPVGRLSERADLLWRFAEAADRAGASPVFYAVPAESVARFADAGFVARKIGETAVVDLAAFSTAGKAMQHLRTTRSRYDREGVGFAVLPPRAAGAGMDELRRVSDAWLAAHHGREKGFSLGRFDPDYLSRFPIAVARREGGVLAFANLWPTADRRQLAVDLMRHTPDAPPAVMDFLFLRVIEWAKAEGFAEFDLGMAPLSGLQDHKLAPLLSRLGALVYSEGEGVYGFKGLRAFKTKFAPEWRPLYIAAPPRVSFPTALLDVALLTSGGWRGMLAR